MTFPDDGFFHALQQDSDDTLRLVFADFLEERGDEASIARAELIRTQIELQNLQPHGPQFLELADRQNTLIETWEREWLGKWTKILTGWSFRRGLVEAVCADASQFLEHAGEWFAEWPTLSVVKLTRAREHLPRLGRIPWLAHLRGLDLSGNGISERHLIHLTTSRYISLLRALDLNDNPIGQLGMGLLADSMHAEELFELHLSGCGLASGALRRLMGGRGDQWKRLDLSNNRFTAQDMIPFAESPALRNFVSLDLSFNPLNSAGIETLASSPNVIGLVDLGVASTNAGNGGIGALAKSRFLSNLRSLDIRGHRCWQMRDLHGVDLSGIVELSKSPLLARLQRFLIGRGIERNDWIADVMKVARPPRQTAYTRPSYTEYWIIDVLRDSKYLMPSQLMECDYRALCLPNDAPSHDDE